jgi:2-iminobutanoate/2-iminopropanoate deaminase
VLDISFLTVPGAPPPPPTAAYSHAVRAGDFLFVTGQLGVEPKGNALVPGGAEEQTKQIMRNLEMVLKGAGTSLDRTVMARIYLVNFAADYPAMNRVYSSYFKEGRYPSRTTVGVTNLALGAMVEIDLIVAL